MLTEALGAPYADDGLVFLFNEGPIDTALRSTFSRIGQVAGQSVQVEPDTVGEIVELGNGDRHERAPEGWRLL